MELKLSSIHTIDRENNMVLKNKPKNDEFYNYFTQVLEKISKNKDLKNYLPKSNSTEVVSLIRKIIKLSENNDEAEKSFEAISQRLLEKEVEAQKRIDKMHREVQVGTLMQALFYDECNNFFLFLIAKVQHIDFVNNNDLTFQSGFPKDLKVFKSCIFYFDDQNQEVNAVQLHLNNVAKYWSDDFLELRELTSDEKNTETAFKAVDGFLNRRVKIKYPEDRASLRNYFITYFRQNSVMKFNEMIDSLFESYQPISDDFPKEKIKAGLLELPTKRSFDSNFTIVSDIIKARITTTYDVYSGITLKVSDNREVITVIEESGKNFLKIPVSDETTYNEFKYI